MTTFKEVEDLRKAVIGMFNFVHDVISDIADEDKEWFKSFNDEWDKYAKDLENE